MKHILITLGLLGFFLTSLALLAINVFGNELVRKPQHEWGTQAPCTEQLEDILERVNEVIDNE
jgi:hypothetical protein